MQETSQNSTAPMLFSTPMVKALLDGSKTQTRRLVKGNIPLGNWEETLSESSIKIGYIIWCRETFLDGSIVDRNGVLKPKVIYKATFNNEFEIDNDNGKVKWKPSLFMPKEACRIFLKVTDVRIERLNDISEDDAIKEGVEYSNEFGYKCYTKNPFFSKHLSASDSYMSLWDSVNGQNSWAQNPWVWVYSFERVECPHGFR